MQDFTFTVTITAATSEQAAIVIAERIYHEEDYGFPYQIGVSEDSPSSD